MITIIPGAYSMIKGMIGTTAKEKGMQVIKEIADSSKKARNSRYEESNVVSNKLKGYYLILALSTTSPPDSLGIWLIDCRASRHFIE